MPHTPQIGGSLSAKSVLRPLLYELTWSALLKGVLITNILVCF